MQYFQTFVIRKWWDQCRHLLDVSREAKMVQLKRVEDQKARIRMERKHKVVALVRFLDGDGDEGDDNDDHDDHYNNVSDLLYHKENLPNRVDENHLNTSLEPMKKAKGGESCDKKGRKQHLAHTVGNVTRNHTKLSSTDKGHKMSYAEAVTSGRPRHI